MVHVVSAVFTNSFPYYVMDMAYKTSRIFLDAGSFLLAIYDISKLLIQQTESILWDNTTKFGFEFS